MVNGNLRVVGYVRVSSAEQTEGFSLDAQRRAIEGYATMQGWTVGAWYEDAGISAATDNIAKRPAFARMLADAEARAFDTLIVHGLDRFARSALVALRTFGALKECGVDLVSIKERWDFTTPVGKLQFGIMAQLAQYYSDNLSTEVKKGLDEKRRKGLHVGGVPWGARRVAGRLALDPARADLLRAIYQRAATHSDPQVAIWLNRAGVASPFGRRWGAQTIRYMRGPGGDWLEALGGAWPALVGAARRRPRQAVASGVRSVYLLSGLLRCPCGAPAGHKRGAAARGGRHTVVCTRPRPPCGHRHTTAARHEAVVEAAVLALDPAADFVEEAPDTAGARDALLARQARVGDRYEAGEIDRAEWRAKRAEIAAALAALPPEEVRREDYAASLRAGQGEWAAWTVAARNYWLHGLVAGVVAGPDWATIRWAGPLATLLGEDERTVPLPPHPPRALARGERHPNARLDWATVRALRARYDAGGVTIRELADEYGLPWSTAREAVRRVRWREDEAPE